MQLSDQRFKTSGERIAQLLFVLILFVIYLYLAIPLPMDQAPDEGMRYDLAKWIYTHKALPIGGEEEIVSPVWGFSYAYNPYLPSILAALLMQVVSLFDTSEIALLVAARAVSALASCGSVFLCFRIGPYVFQKKNSTYLFAVLVGFWPQVMFLSAYHNNDAFSLFSCFLIFYFLVAGRKEHWPVSRCIGLGVAISLCLLTYYYAYGWVLLSVIFCILSCVGDKTIAKKAGFIAQRTALVAAVVLLCAGWYFIRNAIIYDGDILGMEAARSFKATYALTHEVHWPSPPAKQGLSLTDMLFCGDWIPNTLRSYIGLFGYMSILLPQWVYRAYGILLLIGLLLALYRVASRKGGDWTLRGTLLVVAVIPLVISIYGSYTIDYQPQGRYIISSLPAVLCVTVYGYDRLSLRGGIRVIGQVQSRCSDEIEKTEERRTFAFGEWNVSLAAILVALCLGIYSYQGVMLKTLLPQDEVQISVSQDCSYLDLRFETAKYSDGLYFVVCNESFEVDGQWLAATKTDGAWHRIVNLSDYGKSGTYTVHIYRAFADGSMEFAGEEKVNVPAAVHMNLLLTDQDNNIIQMYPIESYAGVYFEVWETGDTEPTTVDALFSADEQCWIADYIFEQGAEYAVLAYTDQAIFIG